MWLAVRVVWMKTVGSSQLLCSLYIPTFFRDFNANVNRFNNVLVPPWIQSAVSCPYRCFITVQQPDSPEAQVSCVVVWRLMPLTVKAVIIVIAAAKTMKYLSGYHQDVMSLIRQTVRSKVCQEGRRERVVWANDCMRFLTWRYMWWTMAGASAPCRTFWSSVWLDGGPGSWNEHFLLPRAKRSRRRHERFWNVNRLLLIPVIFLVVCCQHLQARTNRQISSAFRNANVPWNIWFCHNRYEHTRIFVSSPELVYLIVCC